MVQKNSQQLISQRQMVRIYDEKSQNIETNYKTPQRKANALSILSLRACAISQWFTPERRNTPNNERNSVFSS